ncbi:MAG: anti-sigma F factor [Anaeroplasmataceae bacterium]
MITIYLDAKIENVSISRKLVSVVAMAHNPTVTLLNELKTIVSEGVTNAIIHGYNNDPSKKVRLDIIDDEVGIKIDIIDEGVGIPDIDLALTPMYTSKHENDRSGLGFTIMEIFSDSFNVESTVGSGTRVSILKKWKYNI